MNLIIALVNITACTNFKLGKNTGFIPNYVSAEGKPFESFIRAMFCGIPGKVGTFRRLKDVFSYTGSANNPPDAMLQSGGDAVEIKKVETLKSDVVLNSSLPKTKIHSEDKMISAAARKCEDWKSRDLLYAIGYVPKNTGIVKNIFFFYGDCYAKQNKFYMDKFEQIKKRVTATGEISPDGNEYGTLKDVDGLGNGVYMRVRPINGIGSPWKIFEKQVSFNKDTKFSMVAIMRKSKYLSFPENDRKQLEQSPAHVTHISLVDPDIPSDKIDAMLITYEIT